MKFRKGVTLVEVLIGIGILLMVLVPFASSFISASKTNADSRDKQIATQLAQKYMEEAKRDGYEPPATPPNENGFTITTKIEKSLNGSHTKAIATPKPSAVAEFTYENATLRDQNNMANSISIPFSGSNVNVVVEDKKVTIGTIEYTKSTENTILIHCIKGSTQNLDFDFSVKNNTASPFNILLEGESEERNFVNVRTVAGSGAGTVSKQVALYQPTPAPTTGFDEDYLYHIHVDVIKNDKLITSLDGSKKDR